MTRRPESRLRAALSYAALLCAAPAPAAQPATELWQPLGDSGLAFAVPAGWRAVVSQGKLLASLSIYDPRTATGGRFDTGLTVSLINHLGRIDGLGLRRQIARFRGAVAIAHRLLDEQPLQRGRFAGIGLRYRDDSGAEPAMVYRAYLADTRADQLLILRFQAPVADWAVAWRGGRALIHGFVVDEARDTRHGP